MVLFALRSFRHWFVWLLVLRFNVPVYNLSVMTEWSHSFLGINQYFGELMRHNTVHSVKIEIRSAMVYHLATALPSQLAGIKSKAQITLDYFVCDSDFNKELHLKPPNGC